MFLIVHASSMDGRLFSHPISSKEGNELLPEVVRMPGSEQAGMPFLDLVLGCPLHPTRTSARTLPNVLLAKQVLLESHLTVKNLSSRLKGRQAHFIKLAVGKHKTFISESQFLGTQQRAWRLVANLPWKSICSVSLQEEQTSLFFTLNNKPS